MKLVASADHEVMNNQRRKDPTQADVWRLRWISKEEGSREGPAYLIVKWIFIELAVEIGLDTNPAYQKIAMTGTDARTLLNLTFSQFQVAVVRDPTDLARTQIIVSISIERNKIKETAKTSRARNGGSIGFSIALIPNCTFCLGSLILTRGVQTSSFNAGFTTVDQIFDQPNLEHVDLVPLPWKAVMLKKKIFPMSYKTLNDLWHYVLLVSGFREEARLYSLRSFRVRADLTQLAFKANAGDHSQLFTRLCDVSLSRDANAPVNISPEEELQFENRKDIIELRNAIKKTIDSKERAGLRTKPRGLLKTLGQL
ncbi:hypothetical protein RRF57_009206 [Xylaria bambusicola]|uniref:Uncharacterized protein n=1 Tax=Xylaria bambusicola TaxID=326684 RepID=A0AAN7UQJ7_9PEZI